MGCRNRGEDRISASSSIVNDALLLTTMCLIGLSVDVHIKDSSVYSGIFHTACVDHCYAIVLKRAKMMKKGSCNSNVANEEVIGTLIIQSEDLVQVVAKKVIIPADGIAVHGTGDETGAVACSFSSNGNLLTESNKTMTSKSNVGQPYNHVNQYRRSSGIENGFANGFRPKNAINSTNVLEVKDTDVKDSTKKEECLKDPDNNRKNGNHTSSSTPSETVTTKISNSNRTTKEFKLNPGAKIFSPSFPNKRSPTPQAMVTGANLVYNPDSHPGGPVAVPQPEVEISPFAIHSVPVKFVPYGGNDVQHPPPFNREADGSLKPLPAKHVDTGMGFERLTSILQNKNSNYDTDVFLPIFDAIQKATGARPYSGKVGPDDVDGIDMAYSVVVGHIRTLSFAIADGSRPGNEGREYVLRRILRRAVRYGTEVLKAQKGFLNGLVKVVVDVLGDVFPELKQQEAHIREVIAEEEASFGRTLLHGIEKFKKTAQDVQGKIFSGQDAFILWDTYGFPLDLTQLMAEERGLVVDVEGFNIAMNEARERSRNAQNKQAAVAIVMDADATSALHKKGVAPTYDSFKFIWFKNPKSVIKAIYTGSEYVERADAGDDVGIILESTSFYAEQGGQIYDTGLLGGPSGSFEVCNVQIYGGFVLHLGKISGESTQFHVGDEVICKVDYERRQRIAPNHTCTHMLNFALREVLGNHVDQKGSIVLPEKLRFDFSHGKPVKPDDLRRIESKASLSDAKRVNGLRAVFGEVYPDPVRIVAIGRQVEDLLADPENEKWLSISAELCGGTHISNTREAKAFALLSEEGIAKGIRRVTAVTTDYAFEAIKKASELELEVELASKLEGSFLEQKVTALNGQVESASIPTAKKADLKAKISILQNQVIKAKKKIGEENIRKAVETATKAAETALSEEKAFCISHVGVGSDTAAIREAVVKVMDEKGMAVMVFSTDEQSNKALVCAGVPEKSDKSKHLKVLEWLKAALKPLEGKGGGGKGGLAQGQGPDIKHVDEAIDVAKSFAALKLG